jgi:disulfide bond formation protein DsbB
VDTEVAETFFTVLALLANLATVGILGLAVASRFGAGGPAARRSWIALRGQLAEGGLGVAWLVAVTCTVGSLYFSEVANFEPCRLCWFQRAFMYPLVLVLALAVVWPVLRRVALMMAVIGAGIASYHYLIERVPSLDSGTCDPKVPCTLVWFERLGFVTLPYMALSGFLLIATLLVASGLSQTHPHSPRRYPNHLPTSEATFS